jgi:hypothetical protein
LNNINKEKNSSRQKSVGNGFHFDNFQNKSKLENTNISVQTGISEKNFQEIIKDKDKEIDELKNNIILLEDSLNKKDIEIQKKLKDAEKNFDDQIKLIKDREIYINNQYDNLKEEYDIYKDEKERIIKVIKMELEQLKDKNILL